MRPLVFLSLLASAAFGLSYGQGSIRRECIDHVIVHNETHLRGTLKECILYYNAQRTHLGINKDSPELREVQAEGEIDKVAVANGLHHYYFRTAA